MRVAITPKSAVSRDPETSGIGITERVIAESIHLLNRALSNTSILLIKTRKCHWDVSGPQFMSLHQLLDEQCKTLDIYADDTAERVRMLGGFPVGTASAFLALTALEEQSIDIPNAREMLQLLLRDHETIARRLRESIHMVQENDAGSADQFTGMLRGHEKMAWMLRSFVHEDEASWPYSSAVRLSRRDPAL